MPTGRGAKDHASKIAKRAKPKPKSKGSDSSSDELERADVLSSDEERPLMKKSTKKTAVSEERAAKVINQFTFS
jgi:hypothetical protein